MDETQGQVDYEALLDLPWVDFNNWLMRLTEAELRALLSLEVQRQNRLRVLLRIHNRFNKLRAARERELLRSSILTGKLGELNDG